MLNDWYSLGPAQYRKWHVYDIEWDMPSYQTSSFPFALENYLVSGAPFGGPLAMIPDTKRANLPAEIDKNKILIYTCAGKKLVEIDWQEKTVVGMGWTDMETLTVVSETGLTKIFDLYGRLQTEFQLLESSHSTPILEAHFWGNGVAVLSSNYFIRIAEGLAAHDIQLLKPRLYTLSTEKGKLGVERTYTAMSIIPPLCSRSGLLEVLLATSDHSVLVIHENGNDTELEDQMLHSQLAAPITKISLAPDGKFLACYKKDGVLTVMGTAFNRKIIDFDTRSASRPIAIQWCGKDSVILQWRNTGLVMVGPFGDWINFPYETQGIHIVPELDCCRIVTTNSCEILQMVPPQTAQALEIGSTDPAALILDAMEAFEDGDPKSDENIRMIAATNQLNDAVMNCIQAAAAEFFPQQQQRLLKAASYGKAFCPDLDPTEFVETAKKLRVLNEVRRSEIGLPLTIQQYNRLTPEVLVGRLTSRNCHFLALKICELLKLKNERILIHWACEKVRRMASSSTGSSMMSDEEINRTIKAQLSPYGRISYLAVAEAAYSIGRRKLATIILDREQQPDDQIPLLLKMNEEELALQKAINSEDTDLIYYTIIALESRARSSMLNSGGQKSYLDNFYRIIHNYPEAANLLKIYYRQKVSMNDRSILNNLLLYSKNYLDAGNAAVNQANKQYNPGEKLKYFKESINLFNATPKSSNEISFVKTMIEDELDLLEIQKSLELRFQNNKNAAFSSEILSFDNLSIHEILSLLVELGQRDINELRGCETEITKIMKKFKIADKMIYHIKINCYSKYQDWNNLQKLANEKKSPIGYRPFAVACLKNGANAQEIEKYIEKITVLEDKYELYMELKNYYKSMEMAQKLKDPYRLQEVGRLCQDPGLERQIQEILNKL